ncbi:MAG: TlpA family protein disulfide reductase [Candidatus Niyogibacteria bacterium]|nr:MAG: TlpA family protein disulfide reductase [Candidatus Niyogibacteria bacterium]
MRNKILIIGAIIAAIGLIAFGRSYGGNTASQSASVHSGASGTALQESSAPDFKLQKLGGGTITLSEFRGKKPVVVDFWASWCPNCRRDMPNLNRFYEKYKDKVEVIGVNLHENESTVADFIESRGINFPIALDPFSRASNVFGIQYTNTHFLIDINGNLVRTIPGDIRESDVASLIE